MDDLLPALSGLRLGAPTRAAGDGAAPAPQPLGPDHQAHLMREGYVVLPTPLVDPQMLGQARAAFDQHFLESPEFLAPPRPLDDDWTPVLGGFGALGNPSSFHHPFVRKMREMCEAWLLDNDALPLNGRRLEQCFDRLMRRPKGLLPDSETWHRDESVGTQPGDDIFGGWINLDTQSQYFSCAPRTHLEASARDRNNGFAKITDPAEKAHYQSIADAHGPVEIPVGHMLVFYERLVHEVLKKKATYLMRRMFLGWRATTSHEPLFGTERTNQWITTQEPPLIKSGQIAKMFANLHANLHIHKIIEVYDKRTYQPQCYSPYAAQSKDPTKWYHNLVHQRIHNPMKSLAEYGLPMHPAYEPEERKIMFPQRRVQLHTFDDPSGPRVAYRVASAAEWEAYDATPTWAATMDAYGNRGRLGRPGPERVTAGSE